MKYLIVFISFIFFLVPGFSQSGNIEKERSLPASESEFDSIYNHNIKLKKINGVYIPENLSDAFLRLELMTPAEAIEKFKNEKEEVVTKKLHFGIGRWMIVNWNFYQGSRLSHYLRQKGVTHPDDMAQFLLRTFHRHLWSRDLDQEALIKELTENRKKEVDYLINN